MNYLQRVLKKISCKLKKLEEKISNIEEECCQETIIYSPGNGILISAEGEISIDESVITTLDWISAQGFIDSSFLQGYATESWVDNKGFLISSDLNGFATEQWVQNQNYLTQHQDISGKADKTVSITGVGALEGGGSLASSSSLDLTPLTKEAITKGVIAGSWGNHADEDYATETWVSSQGFLTQHQSLSGYATESWVQSQGFSTQNIQGINNVGSTLEFSFVSSFSENTTFSDGVNINGGIDYTGNIEGEGNIILNQGGIVAKEGHIRGNNFIGKAHSESVSGSFNIDIGTLVSNYNLELTGSTIINIFSMGSETDTVVFTMVITGDFPLAFPSSLFLDSNSDLYNGTIRNLITIHIEKGGITYKGTYSIKNL